jgi:hypothetical protein
LQYGVPLEVYISKFAHMRFVPSGMTNDPDIRLAFVQTARLQGLTRHFAT